MRPVWFAIAPLLLVSSVAFRPLAIGAEPAVAARSSAAEDSVRSTTAAYRKALDSKDVDAVAAFWTPEADYVDQLGRVYKIHDGLKQAKKLSQEGLHIAHIAPKTETLTIRFATPDVAIEDGTFDRIGRWPGRRRKDATRPCG